MVSKRRTRGATADDGPDVSDGNIIGAGSTYEELRNQRIKENKERMLNLGIFDLSLKLKSQPPKSTKTSRNVSTAQNIPTSDSSRRSSRLKTMKPVDYTEINIKTKKQTSKDLEIRIKEGSKPEIYNEEHMKLLGDCKTAWILSVDGHGEDGKRIYDSENGETCHQCRQKTLGLRTHCSNCNLVQGQFCGDCLYARYGENVTEVNENPDWICPVCRDICNCSLCRKAKGWEPTGQIYKKVVKLGFKSVAHYLIESRQVKNQPQVSDSPSNGPQLEHQNESPDLQIESTEAN